MPAHISFLTIAANVVVAIYIGLCVTIVAMQVRFVYFPLRRKAAELETEAAEHNLVPVRNEAGNIIAWRTTDGDPGHTVVVFHGNAGNAPRRTYLVTAIRAARMTPQPGVVIMEYPGYGARPGTPSEKTLTAAALDLIGRIPGKIVLLGESLGTGLACKAAGLLPERISGVALLTPYNRLTTVARLHYPIFPFRLLFQQKYNSEKNLLPYPGPVAFLLAEHDPVVPAKLGMRLYNAYPGGKRLWFVKGAAHNDISAVLSPADWRDILDFVFPVT